MRARTGAWKDVAARRHHPCRSGREERTGRWHVHTNIIREYVCTYGVRSLCVNLLLLTVEIVCFVLRWWRRRWSVGLTLGSFADSLIRCVNDFVNSNASTLSLSLAAAAAAATGIVNLGGVMRKVHGANVLS